MGIGAYKQTLIANLLRVCERNPSRNLKLCPTSRFVRCIAGGLQVKKHVNIVTGSYHMNLCCLNDALVEDQKALWWGGEEGWAEPAVGGLLTVASVVEGGAGW